MKKLLIIFVFYIGINNIQAQYGFPGVNAGPDVHICTPDSTTLTATIVATGATNSYMVSSIPCNPPFPYNTGNIINNGIDDRWSTLINLPFNFCFYGNVYNKIVAGSNGVITFDITKASPSLPLTSVCPWAFTANCPSPSLILNAIYGVYHDIDPNVGGNMYSAVIGTYPFRTYVVSWNQVPMFSGSCNNLLATHQIVLYESTNIIEVYIQNKPLCSSWNGGAAIVGIQNSTGSTGIVAPGRNTTPTWSAQNEAWRFTPNGATNYFLEWWQGSNQISSVNTIRVNPSQTTTYVAKGVYMNCDFSAIEVTDTVVVYVHPKPDISAPLKSICKGDTTSITAVSNVPNTNFVWNPGGNVNPLIASPSTTTNYTIYGTTAFGCKDTTTTTITVNPNPIVTTISGSACGGDTAILKASGGSKYLWDNGDTTATIKVSPINTTTYHVTVFNQFGCKDTSSAIAVINPKPIVQLSSNATICKGDFATLIASGGLKYLWSTNDTISTISVSPNIFTTYSVLVTDANGCFDTSSVNVTVIELPVPIISQDVDTICKGTSTTLTASGGSSYLWNNGDSNPSILISPFVTSSYSVTVTNTINNIVCSATTSTIMNVRNCNMIYIPNSFAPFGYNPIFKPIGETKSTKNYSFQIFNRWGQMIFETTDIEKGWDGKFHGEYVQAGAYIYVLKFISIDEKYEKVGTVTVLF